MKPRPPSTAHPMFDTAEGQRLLAMRQRPAWRQFGPYLSERQWGTVREDYSTHGNGWDSFPFEHAAARAYRWGEDGLAGFGDKNLYWCLGLALWNGRDERLKERLFGLTNDEGNHGEDVKELYYYLDGLPSHAYMRMLYKYPQRAFPYQALRQQNQARGLDQPEYELLDTGIFDENRYFDVVVEYAKASPDDILMRVTTINRGPDPADLHVLPQCWARNIWSWQATEEKPQLTACSDTEIAATHPQLPAYRLYVETSDELLFCDNDTHARRLFPDAPEQAGYFKDGIDACVVRGQRDAVNPARSGTKCAMHHRFSVPAGQSVTVRLRWRAETAAQIPPFTGFDTLILARRDEADAFYAAIQSKIDDPEARRIQRQALAGMLWSKQLYYYDVHRWLEGDSSMPPPPTGRRQSPNASWTHLHAREIITMPDCWEYPWFAAWDQAFHSVPLALIDPQFAKQQLLLLTRESYMHPNAQLPGYEYDFSDVNPPLHAWAALKVYQLDSELYGQSDRTFLELIFNKLCLNFTWWVNRKDANGRNIFQGGFLGLDNISLFNRSMTLPPGHMLNQSDGTAWMAMYALNLMRIALELAPGNAAYEHMAARFFEHFLHIAEAAAATAGGLWDEEDAFFYDHLRLPDGTELPLRIRSLVGLIPLCAVEVLREGSAKLPVFARRLRWFLRNRPDLAELTSFRVEAGEQRSTLLSMLRGEQMQALLRRMLDEAEFLSPYGIRSLSKHHAEHPFTLEWDGQIEASHYWPGESRSHLFGGNSNWRGPVWMPMNYLLIDSLRSFHRFHGKDFTIEYPTGSGQQQNLAQIADHLARRQLKLFLPDPAGRRPFCGETRRLWRDPHFKEWLLFYEYFDGDTGRGCGASHQTGWTALIASLIHELTERGAALRD